MLKCLFPVNSGRVSGLHFTGFDCKDYDHPPPVSGGTEGNREWTCVGVLRINWCGFCNSVSIDSQWKKFQLTRSDFLEGKLKETPDTKSVGPWNVRPIKMKEIS